MVSIPYKNTVLVFDLDDTLYREYDFLLSGFKSISQLYVGKENEVLSEMLVGYKNGKKIIPLDMKASVGLLTRPMMGNTLWQGQVKALHPVIITMFT